MNFTSRLTQSDICVQDICNRLDGSVQRAAAILNGDIQEAKGWLLKYERALEEIFWLEEENLRLKREISQLKTPTAP